MGSKPGVVEAAAPEDKALVMVMVDKGLVTADTGWGLKMRC